MVDRSGTTAYFGRLAKTYGEGEYFRRRRVACIAAIASELNRARSILDLGCGNGGYLRDLVLVAKHARMVGADLSVEMMSEARHRVGARAQFVRADAGAPPFKAGSWDLVLCSHVLQFVPDLDRCVSGIARCLRAGGALVTTLEYSRIRETLGAIMTPQEWDGFSRAIFSAARAERANRPGEDAYRAAFQNAGLAPELRTAPFTVTWADIEEWVRVRWIPIASESGRADIERIMARLRDDGRIAGLTLNLAERILVGRKPGTTRV